MGFRDIVIKLAGDLKHVPSAHVMFEVPACMGKNGCMLSCKRQKCLAFRDGPRRACGSFQTSPRC